MGTNFQFGKFMNLKTQRLFRICADIIIRISSKLIWQLSRLKEHFPKARYCTSSPTPKIYHWNGSVKCIWCTHSPFRVLFLFVFSCRPGPSWLHWLNGCGQKIWLLPPPPQKTFYLLIIFCSMCSIRLWAIRFHNNVSIRLPNQFILDEKSLAAYKFEFNIHLKWANGRWCFGIETFSQTCRIPLECTMCKPHQAHSCLPF